MGLAGIPLHEHHSGKALSLKKHKYETTNMKLRSPHTDPYSTESKIKDELDSKGYGTELQIIDSEKLADGDGNHYLNTEVSVDLVYRNNPDNKGFSNSSDNAEEVEFYALSGKGGLKGHIERRSDSDNLEALDNFLAEVARDDKLSTHFY